MHLTTPLVVAAAALLLVGCKSTAHVPDDQLSDRYRQAELGRAATRPGIRIRRPISGVRREDVVAGLLRALRRIGIVPIDMAQAIAMEADLILTNRQVTIVFDSVTLTQEKSSLMLADLGQAGLETALVEVAAASVAPADQVLWQFPPPPREFVVTGAVRNPGTKPFLSGMTALRAIQASGGVPDALREFRVEVTHPDGYRESAELTALQRGQVADLLIRPGDRLVVAGP